MKGPTSLGGAELRVLIVDDSAVFRGILSHLIASQPDLTVAATATNGRQALDVLNERAVDVVLLDVEMPELDGLATLPLIVARHPNVRVLMASSLTTAGAAVTLQALSLGAADFFAKPAGVQGGAAREESQRDLLSRIRAVGAAARAGRAAALDPSSVAPSPTKRQRRSRGATAGAPRPSIVAMACSTGGPNALATVLAALPDDFPLPILITQHMPPLFTPLLAARLSREQRPCVEATDGTLIQGGTAYVAPGDHHLVVRLHQGRPHLFLTREAPVNHCRPSADPMLSSVADVYGAGALAIVLTGMGEDGRDGCAEVRARGGWVVAQDEATSVVWGMPGSVVAAGLANDVVALDQISACILALTEGAPS